MTEPKDELFYSEEDFERFRKLPHWKASPECVTEWVSYKFGMPTFTFDRKIYYNGYADRDLLTPEQVAILRKEGAFGCPPFRFRSKRDLRILFGRFRGPLGRSGA